MRAFPLLGLLLGLMSCGSETSATAPVLDASKPAPICARPPRASAPDTCNGARELCARTFDKVSFAMTHNAMANSEDKFAAPNQNHSVARQLESGVRGLMLDTHYYDVDAGQTSKTRLPDVPAVEQAYLCHGVCQLGKRKLFDTLCDVTRFLDGHRGEVVSIIFESNITAADTAEVMKQVGLTDYVYTHRGAWPTLREMIDRNTRLVVFTEGEGGAPEWYHPAWSLVFDTPYTFSKQSELSCALNRGRRENPLFLMNHWILDPLANPARAAEVNAESVLLARARQCAMEAGRPPTFIGVDFYELGDVLGVVRTLNL